MEDHNKEKTIMDNNQSTNSSRMNRNLTERNRRILMKNLFSELYSLIPTTTQDSRVWVPELLELATTHIKQLQEKIEKMREKKQVLLLKGDKDEYFEPVMKIKTLDNSTILEVIIISGMKRNFLLYQVISVLQDEGAQVMSTAYHFAGHRVFYTIHSQAISSRIGIEVSRVEERLKKLIF